MNTELSPQIGIESQISKIPILFKKLTMGYHKSSEDEQRPLSCQCPHVLISDDDSFQEFYYQVLFQKMIESRELPLKKEEFRLSVFKSGEELLEKYSSISAKCDCESCLLIITDYDMGRQKMNGIETSQALRKVGYKGSIILRTSEKEEDLCQMNPNFKELLETKIIDSFQEKNKKMIVKDFLNKSLRNSTQLR